MKKTSFLLAIIINCFSNSIAFSQEQEKRDSLGLPGDNLNLYAVLNIFQSSKTLEEFEDRINTQNINVNNLDLNGDNKVDYIKVIDNVQGTSHAIVLQVPLSEKESQDVAVIELEKDKDNQVKVQIVGDEQLYGKNYIVEPKQDNTKGTPNPGYKENKQDTLAASNGNTIVENNTTNNNYYDSNYGSGGYGVGYVSGWPIVHYIYVPVYRPYISPWYWGYYPNYWNPWTPMFWHLYYGQHLGLYVYYHRSLVSRTPEAHGYYGPRKTSSQIIGRRTQEGLYNGTYSRPDLAPRDNRPISNPRGNKPVEQHINKERPRNNAEHDGVLHERNHGVRNNPRVRRPPPQRPAPIVKPSRPQNHIYTPPAPRPQSRPRPAMKGGGGRHR